jgi:hypothetical protein
LKKIWAIAALLFITMFFFGLILPHCIHNYPLSKWGLYGDSWGSINALASVAAFIGVLISLHMQNKENEDSKTKIKTLINQQNKLVNEMIDQGKKNIRPYLNIYFDLDESHALVIKNVGKSACTNFHLEATCEIKEGVTLDKTEQRILEILKNVINNYKLSIIPAGIEYAIPLDGTTSEGYKAWFDTYKNKVSFKIHAFFDFQGKTEDFIITYEIDHYPTVRSKDRR